ncbi:hypothetical protein PLICRDRAFT_58421 [Plicaturopsis crispa FD-325 SS-3]|uniref:Uncharacterized protein n=1 Tax=Plicaturopsis crispa FD-325 SS-3 TaxID=944288 RepID=A0A0C9SVY7_PLICR|nr:hypothetical protein PLICRDRAFT_58421 [Plicaturopsis crispa FD-325 SS-3]
MPRKRMRTRAPSSASEVKFDKSLVEEIDTSAMSRFRRLENDNQRLVDALGESEEQVGKYRDKSKHLAQRVKTLTDAQDTSQRLLDEEREQLADHRDRIDSLVTENQRLSEVNRDLVNERDRLAGGSGGSKPESLDCKPRSPTKVEKQGVEDSVDVELPSLDSGPSLPEPIQKAFEYFNEYMDGASKMRSEAQRNVAEMKQRLEEAEAKLHAKYEEVSRVNAEMELTRRALTDATLRLAEREETLVKAMERSQKADEEIATVKASLSRTEDGLENANQTIAIVTQEATKSHQQLDTINSMLTAAEQERAELGQRLVSTEGNLFDARQECQSLVSKLDEEREGRGRAERRITELQSAIRELPNTLQALLS